MRLNVEQVLRLSPRALAHHQGEVEQLLGRHLERLEERLDRHSLSRALLADGLAQLELLGRWRARRRDSRHRGADVARDTRVQVVLADRRVRGNRLLERVDDAVRELLEKTALTAAWISWNSCLRRGESVLSRGRRATSPAPYSSVGDSRFSRVRVHALGAGPAPCDPCAVRPRGRQRMVRAACTCAGGAAAHQRRRPRSWAASWAAARLTPPTSRPTRLRAARRGGRTATSRLDRGAQRVRGRGHLLPRRVPLYEHHIWDAYGAVGADGAARAAALDALVRPTRTCTAPRRSRCTRRPARTTTPGRSDYAADLVEVRVAASSSDVALLVRTTVMTADEQAAVLVLADTAPGGVPRPVPFGSGLTRRPPRSRCCWPAAAESASI